MKKIFYILSFILLSISCTKQEHTKLSVENLYILKVNNCIPEYGPDGEEDSTYMQIHGLAEFNKNFSIDVINRNSHRGEFSSWVTKISDSVKLEINRIITNYKIDTLYYEEPRSIYDGPVYILLIKKEKNKFIRVGPTPWTPKELINICKLTFEEDNISYKRLETNQDSVKSILRSFEKYVVDIYKPPPPPAKLKIKFIAPVINLKDEN